MPADVDLGSGLARPAVRPVWLGSVWSRLGRNDLAWAFWDRVGAVGVQPWLAAERGRCLRELGLHEEAERLEWPALATATDPVHEAMLRISLAADAVGRGDVDAAVRRWESAAVAAARMPDTPAAARQRLRLAWVDVEVSFVAGRPRRLPDSLPTSADAPLPAGHEHGTTFHHAKSLLFAGITTPDEGAAAALLGRARALAPPVLAWAVALARADRGVDGALDDARRAWGAIVPPPGHEEAVAATPTARRLTD